MTYCLNCGREVQQDASFCPNCGRDLRQTAPSQPMGMGGGIVRTSGGLDSDASTARTLTLVAIIIQTVFFVIGLFIASFFFSFAPFAGMPMFGFGFVGLVFGLGFTISIIWIVLDYFFVYANLQSPATVSRARSPALVLGIVQLIFGGFIAGILLIIAYVKIGDSMRRVGAY